MEADTTPLGLLSFLAQLFAPFLVIVAIVICSFIKAWRQKELFHAFADLHCGSLLVQ